jgi:AcrR family transcriptional regulator
VGSAKPQDWWCAALHARDAGLPAIEDGLDASLNEVARRAGVGVATLFRRFPTRDDLIAAAFADPMAEYAALIETALADPDPWHGFCDYVRAVCAMQAGDRGFTDVLTQSFPSAKEFGAQRDEAFRRFTELIDRAKQTGGLRQDFVAEDLPMLLMANAGVVAATAGSTPETSPGWSPTCSKPSPRKPASRSPSRPRRSACTEPSAAWTTRTADDAEARLPSRPVSQRPLGGISERSDLNIPQGTHTQSESNPGVVTLTIAGRYDQTAL